MLLQFTLWLIEMDLLQFLDTALLIQFKIIAQCVFANSYDLCNLLVHQPVGFHPNGIHPPLHQRYKMIVALVVDFFHDF